MNTTHANTISIPCKSLSDKTVELAISDMIIYDTLSEEQKQIAHSLETNNIIVDAVAGSGKTTTNLALARIYVNVSFLLLTYNKQLRQETMHKVEKLAMSNCEVHTYHSFYNKYYGVCANDINLDDLLEKDTPCLEKFSYDVIILDEAQDIRPILYRAIKKVYRDNMKKIRKVALDDKNFKKFELKILNSKYASLVVVGDVNQNIYGYQHADYRYLSLANNVFDWNTKPWCRLSLSVSYRLQPGMAEFINNVFLGYSRIKTREVYIPEVHHGNVRYTVRYPHTIFMAKSMKTMIKKGGSFNDFLIMCYTLKSPAIRNIANDLSRNGIPIYYPSQNEELSDRQVLNNKVLFSSFHQSKGIERKYVFILGFDDNLCYYSPEFLSPTCQNILYVALSRASKRLFLFHSPLNNYLKCVQVSRLAEFSQVEHVDEFKETSDIREQKLLEQLKKREDGEGAPRNLTDVLNHISYEVLKEAVKLLHVKKIQEPRNILELKNAMIEVDASSRLNLNVDDNSMTDIATNTSMAKTIIYENVSNIIGSCIPLYFENRMNGNFRWLASFQSLCESKKIGMNSITDPYNNKLVKDLKLDDVSDLVSAVLRESIVRDNLVYKASQVQKRELINEDELKICYSRLCSLKFSRGRETDFETPYIKDGILGRLDAVDWGTRRAFEFKCTSELKYEHMIQVAMYKYLSGLDMAFYLYNILSDELLLIDVSLEEAEKIFKLMTEKEELESINDREFINKHT